jgi:pyruvate kinase
MLILDNQLKRKTVQKILVTLGPSSLTKEVVQDCDKSDVYLYQVNLSHTDLQDIAIIIKKNLSYKKITSRWPILSL